MWWRKVIASILGWRVIWVRDFDGDIYMRLASPTGFGWRAYACSREFGLGEFTLLDGGKVEGCIYVDEWRDA